MYMLCMLRNTFWNFIDTVMTHDYRDYKIEINLKLYIYIYIYKLQDIYYKHIFSKKKSVYSMNSHIKYMYNKR